MSKKKTRRSFLETSLKTSLSLPLLATGLYSCQPSSQTNSNSVTKKLKILILGGTSFLGPHQIAYALKRGHSVSIFTRGKTKPTIYKDLFEKVEHLVGDRNDNLKALENKKWDVVIDNSGRNVKWTTDSAALLKNNCQLYLYTSSTGVYYPYLGDNIKEDQELLYETPEVMNEEEKLEYDYGVMKANSEKAAVEQFGNDRTIIVRPTYMIGPADRTDRFIHWPVRLSKGGEILVPGKSNDPVQYIDVRDVAEWMIRLIESKSVGTYNAVGPQGAQNIHSFVKKAAQSFDVKSSFIKIDDYDFLKANDIYYIVPWIMPTEKNYGSSRINNHYSIKNGLTFRSLNDSVDDIFKWWNSDAVSKERRNKLENDEKSILKLEASILEKWKSRTSK